MIYKLLAVLTLVFSIFLISCQDDEVSSNNDDDDNNNNNNNNNNTELSVGDFQCKVNGNNWSTSKAGANLAIGTEMQIIAQDNMTYIFQMMVSDFSEGTYNDTEVTLTFFSITNPTDSKIFRTSEGTVVIEDRSYNIITGTFEFTAVDADEETATVTDGKFKLKINNL